MRYFVLPLFLCAFVYAQTLPTDFKLIAGTGGGYSRSENITILASGSVEFASFQGGNPPKMLIDTTFKIGISQVQQVWQAIQNNNFFSLNSSYQDDSILDGSAFVITVIANADTHQVFVQNKLVTQIQQIISTINSVIPSSFNLNFTPAEKVNVVPNDPCGGSIINQSSALKKMLSNSFDKNKTKKMSKLFKTRQANTEPAHGGVEVGWQYTLYDAVGHKMVSLKTKGGYFGDVVSITGDNSGNIPPADNDTIYIKLNLEFYGPCDNSNNELKVASDILNTWDNGYHTTSGNPIQVEVDTRAVSPGTTSPPGTPGWDDINLKCGNGRSFCNGAGSPNDGVDGGIWYPSDSRPHVFGHEAGHLMGLPDYYDDWMKQPDGSWKDSKTGNTLSNSDFLTYYHSKFPNNNLPNDQQNIVSIPTDDHENNLMSDLSNPTQKEIDEIASHAGIIFGLRLGDLLVNEDDYEQNLVVDHSDDLVLMPGEKKTLNGVYTVCIDLNRDSPDSGLTLDVAPPLGLWNGIPSAQSLLKLLQYIDIHNNDYCGSYASAQFAVWYITDNATPADSEAYGLLTNAGINIKQYFNFPRISYGGSDTVSAQYVPDQLFIANIQPKSVAVDLNQAITFTGAVSFPSVGGFATSFSWKEDSTDFNSAPLTINGDKATLLPSNRGIYALGLNITVKDSTGESREINSDATSYAVVADKSTETFEHKNLDDLFPWSTFGNASWTITSNMAQTGQYSVQPGNVANGQSSSLGIIVNLPSDSAIAFAIKTSTSYGDIEFDVDSIPYYDNYGFSDWTFKSFNLSKGQHLLTWTYSNYSSTLPNSPGVWLDNIFFPTNSTLIASVKSPEEVPHQFKLFQNYPNPFNPSTTISYSIPKASFVTIKIYDVLGREVKTLVNKNKTTGNYSVNFNASNLSSGIYFYQLKAGDYVQTRKMILLK